MSRHQRKVPVSFYHRFAQDARRFADAVAGGRLISVLEGGYSDRALTSGVIAHLAGLGETEAVKTDPEWWKSDNLVAVCPPWCASCQLLMELSGSWRRPRRSGKAGDHP